MDVEFENEELYGSMIAFMVEWGYDENKIFYRKKNYLHLKNCIEIGA